MGFSVSVVVVVDVGGTVAVWVCEAKVKPGEKRLCQLAERRRHWEKPLGEVAERRFQVAERRRQFAERLGDLAERRG